VALLLLLSSSSADCGGRELIKQNTASEQISTKQQATGNNISDWLNEEPPIKIS
jgi:hypothetical protein